MRVQCSKYSFLSVSLLALQLISNFPDLRVQSAVRRRFERAGDRLQDQRLVSNDDDDVLRFCFAYVCMCLSKELGCDKVTDFLIMFATRAESVFCLFAQVHLH